MNFLRAMPLEQVTAALRAAEAELQAEGANLSVRGRGGQVPPRTCLGQQGIGAARVAALVRASTTAGRVSTGSAGGNAYRWYFPAAAIERANALLTEGGEC